MAFPMIPFSQPIKQDTMQKPFLCVVNDILSALNKDNTSILLLLDLSKAFDTVDHQILLSHLNSVLGIQSAALQWFQSYLSDRYQSTSVNNIIFFTITVHVQCASGLSTWARSLCPVHYTSF